MKLSDLLQFDNIIVQCHDNPDADALASGFGVYEYLRMNGKSPRLVYGGRNIIHKSNLVLMVDSLGIPIEHVDFLDNPQLLVTVDCQYGGGNVTFFKAENVAVIDHHRVSGELPAMNRVMSYMGSCATIVWDMLRELRKRGIPVYIISAIFRPDQLFFQWFGKPYRKMLSYFNHLFVQDERSMKLLNEFGITNVTVTGDTRFDRVLDVRKQARELPFIERFLESKEGKRPIVMVAGSSWPQDEAIFIPYFHEHPEMKLIIAPHEIHREHLLSIEAMLKRPSVRLSEAHEDDLADKDCLIIDSFGLLSSIYRYGQIAYIGGGFGAGIHNTLEAAVYGMPVLFGPRYHKFKEAKDLIAVGGGFSITDDSSFRTKMDELLTDPTALETSGQAAGDFVKNSVGATDQILRQIHIR